jgi:hypothetical protein
MSALRAATSVAGLPSHNRSLFSARIRSDDRPRAWGEPSYDFLDRAAGSRWQRVRDALDAWYLRLPEAARRDLRNRFTLDAELAHAGAFWELWVHEAHRRLGFDVEVHVGIDAGARRQDFLVARGEERFWLEATVVGGDSPLSFTEQKLDEALCDLIDTVRAPGLSLALEVLRYGSCQPARRRVVPRIEGWLRGLDPEELRARQAASGVGAATRRFTFEGWEFELEAIPRDETRPLPVEERRVLAPRAAPCRDAVVNDVRPLRRKIKKKAARYGELDRPYLLAVLALGDFVEDRDVTHALLGAAAAGCEAGGRARPDHAVWIGPGGPCNTRLSGVLVARGLTPARLATTMPTLWRNPWALRPLEVALPWRTARRADDRDAAAFGAAATDAATLFGLAPGPSRFRLGRPGAGTPRAARPATALAK